jgi:hypothetical protein
MPDSGRCLGGAAYRNRTDDLRITRVFSCVARGSKARAIFIFADGSRWRSLAVDGSSGASRGHAPLVRRPGFPVRRRLYPAAPGICPAIARTLQGMAPYPGQARCLALVFWPEWPRRLRVKSCREKVCARWFVLAFTKLFRFGQGLMLRGATSQFRGHPRTRLATALHSSAACVVLDQVVIVRSGQRRRFLSTRCIVSPSG